MQSKIHDHQDRHAEREHAGRLQRIVRLKRDIERWNVRHAIEATEKGFADVILRSGGRIDDIVEDKRNRQRDDADIDVADARIEYEISESGCKCCGQLNRNEKRQRAFAHVDDANCVSIGAQTEEGGMAEAKNASITPDESEADCQDSENHIQRDLQESVEVEREGQTDQQHYSDDTDSNEGGI